MHSEAYGLISSQVGSGYSSLCPTVECESDQGGEVNRLSDFLGRSDIGEGAQVMRWSAAAQSFEDPLEYVAAHGWFNSNGEYVNPEIGVSEGIFVFNQGGPVVARVFGRIPQSAVTTPIVSGYNLIGPAAAPNALVGFPAVSGDRLYPFSKTLQSWAWAEGWEYTDNAGGGWVAETDGETLLATPALAVGEAYLLHSTGPDRNWVRSFSVWP
jgi:hypothetical protein